MAAYLGTTAAQVGHAEAERPTASGVLLLRLAPLAAQVPAEAPSFAELPAVVAPPAAGPLAARLDYCRHHAARLRRELRPLEQAAAYAHRWQRALPALLAATAPGSPAHAWLLRRQAHAAAALDGEASAQYHLRRLRAEAFETEARALEVLLAAAAPEPPSGLVSAQLIGE